MGTGAQGIRDMLKARLDAEYKAQEEARRQGAEKIEKETVDTLRQAYISRERQKLSLPQQMALSGAGGVSESANIALLSQYDQSRSAAREKKSEQLSDLNSRIDTARAQKEAEYYNELTELEKLIMEMEEKRRLASMKR